MVAWFRVWAEVELMLGARWFSALRSGQWVRADLAGLNAGADGVRASDASDRLQMIPGVGRWFAILSLNPCGWIWWTGRSPGPVDVPCGAQSWGVHACRSRGCDQICDQDAVILADSATTSPARVPSTRRVSRAPERYAAWGRCPQRWGCEMTPAGASSTNRRPLSSSRKKGHDA
jgi:hypothetical protein